MKIVKNGITGQELAEWCKQHRAEYESLDGRVCSEPPQASTTQLLSRVLRNLGCPTWVYEFQSEFWCFLLRSRNVWRQRKAPTVGVELGHHAGVDASGRLVPCTRTLGRRVDTHKFQNSGYRSLADLAIFLEGWNAGAKWSDDNPHFCTPDKESGLFACMPPETRRPVNLTLRSGVQQSSRRDL